MNTNHAVNDDSYSPELASDAWANLLGEVCDLLGIRQPTVGEWFELRAAWRPGVEAVDSVERLVAIRQAANDQGRRRHA